MRLLHIILFYFIDEQSNYILVLDKTKRNQIASTVQERKEPETDKIAKKSLNFLIAS